MVINEVSQVTKNRFPLRKIDYISLCIALLFANIFVLWYTWHALSPFDIGNASYWFNFSKLRTLATQDFLSAVKLFIESFGDDYNFTQLIPVMPFTLLIGKSWVNFALVLTNVYCLGFLISFLVLLRSIEQEWGVRQRFSTVLLIVSSVLLLPQFWLATPFSYSGGLFPRRISSKILLCGSSTPKSRHSKSEKF